MDGNFTSPQLLPAEYKEELALFHNLIPVFGAFVIILNFIVVVSSGLILSRRPQPRSTYLFLGNVSLADLVTGIAWIVGLAYPEKYSNHYSCAIREGTMVSATMSSIFSVGLIGFDRYLYIVHGLKYETWMSSGRVRLLIIMAWIMGSAIGFLPLMGWYGDTQNGKICWIIFLFPPQAIFIMVTAAMVPVITTGMLYSIILYRAIQKISQLQQMDKQNNSNITENYLRQFRGNARQSDASVESTQCKTPHKWKAVKVVIFTSGTFVITWMPYLVVSHVYVVVCKDNKNTDECRRLEFWLASPLPVLGFLNSLLNPIIYAWWHKGFRTSLIKFISKSRMRNQHVVPNEIALRNCKTSQSVCRMQNKAENAPKPNNTKVRF